MRLLSFLSVSQSTKRVRHTLFSVLLGLCIFIQIGLGASLLEAHARPVALSHEVQLMNGDKLVTITASNANIRELLRDLAREGEFNLLLDDSVEGNLSLEMKNVSLNNAMSAIASLSGLAIIPQNNNIYLVITDAAATQKNLNRQFTKMIPVQFGNATQLSALFNSSLFAVENALLQQASSGGGGGNSRRGGSSSGGNTNNTPQKIKPDIRTNSLIVVGSQRDIDLVEAAVKTVDRPRESRTFYLNYANALDIASQLTSSIFNDGTQNFRLKGASGSGSGGGGQQQQGRQGQGQMQQRPSSLRVQSETLEEGTGINSFSSSNGASTFSQEIVLRGTIKESEMVQISPLGAIVVPDTRLNAVTIFGTIEQIETAAALIPVFDAEPPQVSIDVSLVEISEEGQRELSGNLGIGDGNFSSGFNNTALVGQASNPNFTTPANTGLVGLPTNDSSSSARSGLLYTTNPLINAPDYMIQLKALISNRRAKILASPTVVATHDTEAIISIVDEIIRRINVTVSGQTGTTTVETELGEAGIVLDILPKIGEDGTISMRIRPSITSVRDIIQDANGSITTLLAKRDILAQQVRVRDGETLILGGLVQEQQTRQTDKLPLFGDLPIVGALFRASTNSQDRTEVVLMLTPHILNKIKPSSQYTHSPLAQAP